MSSGTVIYAEPESKVTVVLPTSVQPSKGVTIETFTISNSLYETFRIYHAADDFGNPIKFVGMVSLHTHAEQTLQMLKADSGLGLRAVMEFFSYAIPEAPKYLAPQSARHLATGKNNNLPPTLAKLFPEHKHFEKSIKAYFGPYSRCFHGFQNLPPGSYSKLAMRLSFICFAHDYADFSISF